MMMQHCFAIAVAAVQLCVSPSVQNEMDKVYSVLGSFSTLPKYQQLVSSTNLSVKEDLAFMKDTNYFQELTADNRVKYQRLYASYTYCPVLPMLACGAALGVHTKLCLELLSSSKELAQRFYETGDWYRPSAAYSASGHSAHTGGHNAHTEGRNAHTGGRSPSANLKLKQNSKAEKDHQLAPIARTRRDSSIGYAVPEAIADMAFLQYEDSEALEIRLKREKQQHVAALERKWLMSNITTKAIRGFPTETIDKQLPAEANKYLEDFAYYLTREVHPNTVYRTSPGVAHSTAHGGATHTGGDHSRRRGALYTPRVSPAAVDERLLERFLTEVTNTCYPEFFVICGASAMRQAKTMQDELVKCITFAKRYSAYRHYAHEKLKKLIETNEPTQDTHL